MLEVTSVTHEEIAWRVNIYTMKFIMLWPREMRTKLN